MKKTLDLGNGVVLTYVGKDRDGGDVWMVNDVVLNAFADAKVDPAKHARGGA